MIKKLIMATTMVAVCGAAWGATKCVALNRTMVASSMNAVEYGVESTATFDNGVVVHMVSACRGRGDAIYAADLFDRPPNSVGTYCWCKMVVPYAGKWSVGQPLSNCEKSCSTSCTKMLMMSGDVANELRDAFFFGIPMTNKVLLRIVENSDDVV